MLAMVSEMFITEFGKTYVCIVNREITKKVKTVPHLLDLLTLHQFSLTSARSESVGYKFVTQFLCFYRLVCTSFVC